MAEVTWFKVLTDIFADDKIKIIQSMPEGDSLLVTWFKVLSQAGKTNDGGYIYLRKNIPYTPAMLATLFNKPQMIVELALRTFEQFEMIDIDENGYIFVTNWEKHQSIDALEKIKEQDRIRSANYRERKRLELQENHVTLTLPSLSNHATELELDLDINKKHIVDSDECDETFNRFWNAYPKKNGKAKAIVKWRSYFKNGLIDMELIMNGLENYMKYVEHERTVRKFDRQYLDGLTFVNGERWNDEWTIIQPTQTNPFLPESRNTTSQLELITTTEEERKEHEQLIERIRRQNAANARGTIRSVDSVS